MKTIEVLRLLEKQCKAEVYITGGYVRDFLRGVESKDIDVVVRNAPIETVRKFLDNYGKTTMVELSRTNDLFTVSILLFKAKDDTAEAQITLPKAGISQTQDKKNTLYQDSLHRDFKLNSMYLPINYTSSRDVIDFNHGRTDIRDKFISANGNPTHRINESPIRMLRAISLASRLRYKIDRTLFKAIKVNAVMICKCSAESVKIEFEKILMSEKPSIYLRKLYESKLLKYICPELEECVGVTQDVRYHKYDVFSHLIYTVDNCEQNIVVRLAGLLHDIGKPAVRAEIKYANYTKVSFHKHELVSATIAENFLLRMKYDQKTIKQVVSLVRLHMFHYTNEWTDSAIRKFIKRVGFTKEYANKKTISTFPLFKLRSAERLGNGRKPNAISASQKIFEKKIIEVFKNSKGFSIADLDINGEVIMRAFKLKPGPKIGETLKFLLENVLEKPSLNNRKDLIELTDSFLKSD